MSPSDKKSAIYPSPKGLKRPLEIDSNGPDKRPKLGGNRCDQGNDVQEMFALASAKALSKMMEMNPTMETQLPGVKESLRALTEWLQNTPVDKKPPGVEASLRVPGE